MMKNCCRIVCVSALTVLSLPLWADSPATPAPISPAQTVLDRLIGKHAVIGLTERGGSRYLGRVLSGDHGLYVFQTFHYIGAPRTTFQTTTVTGYHRRSSRRTTRITSQTTVADDLAVKALLSGVTGSTYRPREEAAGREIIAPSDITYIQQLSPPAKAAAVLSAPPANSAASAPVASARWTLKTLWASADLPAPAAVKAGAN